MTDNIARKLDDGRKLTAVADDPAGAAVQRGAEKVDERDQGSPAVSSTAPPIDKPEEPGPADDGQARAPEPPAEPAVVAERLDRLERTNRILRYALLALALGLGWLGYHKVFPEGVTVHKTMMESKELKLLDTDGNARLFLRMYSRVPVLQLMDGNGKPRMSLGLRFDNTPFIDLSDQTGRTRATLEMTEEDAPALRLFNQDGTVKFQIN